MNGSRTTSAELWSRDTDLVLRDLVLRSSEEINWNQIATAIEWDSGAVTPSECRERWDYVKETPVKGPWSSEEDDHLKRLVDEFGSKKWNLLARAFPGRSGKQCRERWHNHVDGRVKKGEWSAEEDQILCEAQRQLGNKWSEMSKILVGRSENAIKNRFNSLNAKGLAEMRANELMSKLAPEEKAALLNIDSDPPAPPRPCSSSTANKKRAGANSTHVGKERVSSSGGGGDGGDGIKSSSSKDKGGDVDGAGGRSKAGSGRKGSASKKRSSSSSSSSSSGDSTGCDGGKSNGSSSNVDGRDDRSCEGSNASSATGFGTAGGGNKSDDDAAAASGGGSGGGGDAGVGRSAAMEALMVAARGERTACGGSGDEGHDGGDPWNNSNCNRGRAEAGARWKRGWAPAGGEGAERRGQQETAGGGGGGAVAEPGRKAAKRPKGGQARRKTDMARAEAGMSVLAQAAGLLDIEDSVEAADGNSNSVGGGGGGDAGRNGPDANVMLATDLVDCRSNFGGSGGGGGGRYAGQYYGRLQTNGHNGNAFIDHGSTPPGSASPPPSGPASGGGGSAAGGASSNGGTGGGCGGRTAGTADAFPVGAQGASSAGHARSIARNSEYYHVGGQSSYGGESGGGERASWGGLPSSSTSWSSSQRWSLHSVPGPWRPYLTGQDGGNGGGGGAADADAARRPRQDEGPDSG
ncbi:unnamed protein product [Ectocarpus sp. 13 AM-2016]